MQYVEKTDVFLCYEITRYET